MTADQGGIVYLVGAGPGDPGLATSRGLQRLGEADLVLYDALVHPSLLDACRPEAAREYVGKRAGRPSARQAEINRRMIEAARAGKVVVRLKGGDPFLFGRGSEEAEGLAEAGVPFEVVPGVPSPLCASAYAGISLTHRDLSSSVAYVTATESVAKDRSSHDWARLATATQTLVIFMGLRKIGTLMSLLIEHGRPASTPAAVVRSASLPSQRTLVGTVGDIAELVEQEQLGMPSLILVGEVVGLRESLRWFDNRPLFGKRILVTRPRAQAPALSRLLRDEAADPIEAPTICIEAPEDRRPLEIAAGSLDRYQWVLFTSRNGVERFFAEVHAQGGDARRLGSCRVVAIGPATARALERVGIRPDEVPDEYRGEAVAERVLAAHGGSLSGVRVLLPRAAVARSVLPNTLRAAGATVDVVPVYRTVPPPEEGAQRVRDLVRDRLIDVVAFTASSTVENMVGILGDGAADALSHATVGSIGPITTATAERLGIRVDVTATEYTNEGLVRALTGHFAES